MKRIITLFLAALLLTAAIPAAFAAEVCYPTYITQSEDGYEIRKIYDLEAGEDPAGIPRSDFEQAGNRYTLRDLLKQELPEYEERPHTETVSLPSKSKDMESVLALLPAERDFITDDGFSGKLDLDLSTVRVEVAGYGNSTDAVSATRTYPNMDSQDTANIPKTIEENGSTLTLQGITWQTDSSAYVDGIAVGDRFTAVATYSGSKTSSYIKGYTVTADYTGTVSRIALNKVRYVAVFEGEVIPPLVPAAPEGSQNTEPSLAQFNWAFLLVPFGVVAVIGVSIGAALFLKHRRESNDESEEDE